MNSQNEAGLEEPIAIVGYGVEGQSTLRWLISQGVRRIAILDRQEVQIEPVQGVEISVHSGADYWKGLQGCKSAVRSAGVYPLGPELLQWQYRGGQLTSQVELFLARSSARVVGVTGTLGKGTCVTMLETILRSAGKDVVVGGNIGIAALDLLDGGSASQVVILELSSFQLMTVGNSPACAVVLRVTSEHLDWHRTVEEYRDAKANLVRYQRPQDTCIHFLDAEGSRWIASQSRGRSWGFGAGQSASCQLTPGGLSLDGYHLRIGECAVRGDHQLENMAAALLAAKSLGVAVDVGMEALRSYVGLPYRLQDCGAIGSVRYFNDSYATRPEAALAAAQSMEGPFALILGGSEKHADFSELAQGLAQLSSLHCVALIGATAGRLQQALNEARIHATIAEFPGLDEALDWCRGQMDAGGSVLMSPACASFGLFANYKVRGQHFDQWVKRQLAIASAPAS